MLKKDKAGKSKDEEKDLKDIDRRKMESNVAGSAPPMRI